MKKLFISQPMRGKTDVEIRTERERMIAYASEALGEDVEVLDTYYKDFNGSRVEFLGRSISDLGKADVAIFAPGWDRFDGCRCEHTVCESYGIPHIHAIPAEMTQECEMMILEAAVEKYGSILQLLVAIEEQAELIKAICKYLRYVHTVEGDPNAIMENMAEERADVSIMLNQMEIIFGDNTEMEIAKLLRLAKKVL